MPTDEPGTNGRVCRLFPLTGVVLFPHVVLPLHIFEPRYRQMTEHALQGDRRIAMVQHAIRPGGSAGTVPEIETVACLGEIIGHERIADGRFNLLLAGRERIRLVGENVVSTLYRQAEYIVLQDIEPDDPSAWRHLLVDRFRDVVRNRGQIDPDVDTLLESDVSLGILTDILTHALGLNPALKQVFLEEVDTMRRAAGLVEVLNQLDNDSPRRHFPPEFSVN